MDSAKESQNNRGTTCCGGSSSELESIRYAEFSFPSPTIYVLPTPLTVVVRGCSLPVQGPLPGRYLGTSYLVAFSDPVRHSIRLLPRPCLLLPCRLPSPKIHIPAWAKEQPLRRSDPRLQIYHLPITIYGLRVHNYLGNSHRALRYHPPFFHGDLSHSTPARLPLSLLRSCPRAAEANAQGRVQALFLCGVSGRPLHAEPCFGGGGGGIDPKAGSFAALPLVSASLREHC